MPDASAISCWTWRNSLSLNTGIFNRPDISASLRDSNAEVTDVVQRQHLGNVEDDREHLVATGHAGNEVCTDTGPERWRLHHLFRVDIQHRIDRIHHQADALADVFHHQLDDHYAGAFARHRQLETEARRQVHDRDHVATQVDHAVDEGRHHRYGRDFVVLDDFSHQIDRQRITGLAHTKRQMLNALHGCGLG